MTDALAHTFTRVAADISRRQLGCGLNAPTDVGGYTRLVNRAECRASRPDFITNNGANLCIVSARARQTRD